MLKFWICSQWYFSLQPMARSTKPSRVKAFRLPEWLKHRFMHGVLSRLWFYFFLGNPWWKAFCEKCPGTSCKVCFIKFNFGMSVCKPDNPLTFSQFRLSFYSWKIFFFACIVWLNHALWVITYLRNNFTHDQCICEIYNSSY